MFCRSRLTPIVLVLLLSACSADTPPPAPAEAAPPAPVIDPSENIVAGSVPVVAGGLPTIVILEPKTPHEVPDQVAKPVMDQISMTFTPAVLLVRTGQPAEFRNSDDVLHNVRVRNDSTREGAFNVALPTGGTYSFTFDTDGFYDVGCDIHPGMAALVVAMSTPHLTLANGEGQFALHDVPPGAYTLIAYAGTQRHEREVQVGAGRTEVSVGN